ncbi:MAG: sodium/proline symporter [Cyclobacteriaceae bacterium]|nr:sodium/proline symporter [Cyclobacteriaceae bacterium]
MPFTLIAFLLYLLAILVVGLAMYRRNKTHEDFILGGRSMNPWVVAFSERASGESAWLLVGLPGLGYAAGYIGMWDAIGCVLGIVLYWIVIAEKLRTQSEESGSITLPDFFASKFDTLQKPIRLTATFIIIFFFTFYLAAQFNGAGKVLNVTFGIPNLYGILIGAIVIVFYTMMGGYLAVAWTDLIQGIIMIGALVILPLVGFLEIMEQHTSLHGALKAAGGEYTHITGGQTGWSAFAVIVSGLSWGLGYMGQPHLLTRFMSIDNVANIRISRRIAYIWAVPGFFGALMIGLVGLVYYGQGAFDDVESVMPQLANDLLPTWLAGIFISGAIAAMMSTADSQLLVITSSVIEDIYHKTLGNSTVSEKKLLRLSRIITIAVGAVAFFISISSQELVFALVSYAWAGLGSSFGPTLLLLLWWKKTTASGVLAGMVAGTLTTIVWSGMVNWDAMLSARLMAWLVALLVVVLVSLWEKNYERVGTKFKNKFQYKM